jgi:nucleoside-diphosphate-sugar epimerase
VDFSKAKSELGWEPKRLLRESISELSTWYLERHSSKSEERD